MYIAVLVFDTVIFSLTLSRALFMSVSSRKNLTLLTLVVRDGTWYFMYVLMLLTRFDSVTDTKPCL